MTPKKFVLRRHPEAVLCPVTRTVYGGSCMSKVLGRSWRGAARRLTRKQTNDIKETS